MASTNALLRLARSIHLYLGIFIAPALLFFALTGALQTFGLHEGSRDGSGYQPPHWVAVLAQIHKHQSAQLPPPRKPAAPAGKAAAEAASTAAKPAAAPVPAQPAPKQPQHLPLKIFFAVVCLGLFSSVVTGLYMSYRYGRSPGVVTAILLLGAAVPLLLLRW